MIAKKISYTGNRSKFSHIRNVYNYIHNLDGSGDKDKVLYHDSFNINGKEDYQVIAEIADLAEKSVRSKNPICHWVISLKDGEHFTPEIARRVVEDFLNDLGFTKCQVAYAVHGNTENEHVHILINRVDPETNKCFSRSNDIFKAQESIARIQKKYSFDSKNHERYVEEDGKYIRAFYTDTESKKGKLPTKAVESEIRSGEKSTARIAKEKAWPVMQKSTNWQELHTLLGEIGFTYELKGGGAVLKMHCEGKITEVKASIVAKKASLKNMEFRLGAFTPAQTSIKERTPEPVSGISPEILNEYKTYKKDASKKEDQEKEKKKKEEKEALEKKINEIKTQQQQAIRQIEDEVEEPIFQKTMKVAYTEHFSEQIRDAKLNYKIKQQEKKENVAEILPFNTWLENNKHNNVDIYDVMKNIQASEITDTNTDIQRKILEERANLIIDINSVLNAEKFSVVGQKQEDNVCKKIAVRINSKSEGYEPKEFINEALPILIRLEQKAYSFFCKPISSKYDYVVFNNVNQDTLSNTQLTPNLVIKTNNDLQTIFKIPKTNDNILQKIISKLKNIFKQKQKIDVNKLMIPNSNTKIIEKNEKINMAIVRYCRAAMFYYSTKNNSEYNKIYQTHKQSILSNYQGISEDHILIAMAIRLRCTGHSKNETAKIISTGNNKNFSYKYIYNKINKAFGNFGNLVIKKLNIFIKQWNLLEQKVKPKWFCFQHGLKTTNKMNNNMEMR